MATQILFNLLIALTWMLLHDTWDALTFLFGFLLGLFMIFMLRRFFPQPFYGKKIYAIVKLTLLFILELVKSSFTVIGQVISPKINFKPGIFKTETKLRGHWEITLLSNLITLTPGSVVLEVIPEEGILYIHGMDITNSAEKLNQTKTRFEKVILEVMN